MDLSIVIPVYNSENIIEDLIGKIVKSINEIKTINSYEILLVNDSSPDNSWDKINLLSEEFDSVKGIDLAENFGQHNAIMCGLNECKGNFVITMDDDLQHPPDSIKDLIIKLNEGHDVCYTNYINRKHPLWKKFVSWLNNLVSSYLLNKPYHIYLSSFRGLKGKIAKELTVYKRNDVYLDGLILKATRNIAMISVPHSQRLRGASNYNLKKLLSLWSNMAVNFPVFPLRISTILGFIIKFIIVITRKILFIDKKTTKLQYTISKKTY
tara:strand:- start:5524 stop:6324 length:801 start_codon:yes stop_codon:yes gene_type:complete